MLSMETPPEISAMLEPESETAFLNGKSFWDVVKNGDVSESLNNLTNETSSSRETDTGKSKNSNSSYLVALLVLLAAIFIGFAVAYFGSQKAAPWLGTLIPSFTFFFRISLWTFQALVLLYTVRFWPIVVLVNSTIFFLMVLCLWCELKTTLFLLMVFVLWCELKNNPVSLEGYKLRFRNRMYHYFLVKGTLLSWALLQWFFFFAFLFVSSW